MRKIAVVTSSRADESPLRFIMQELGEHCVHFKTNGIYGNIQRLHGAIVSAAPDIMLLLGDRLEMLSAAQVATYHKIPIAHIGGGEETTGAIDNTVRHALTKLSYWHFVAQSDAANVVRQMGEPMERIFILGDPQIDAVEKYKPQVVYRELEPKIVFTYHPETLCEYGVNYQITECIEALHRLPGDYKIHITPSNNDDGGYKINERLKHFAEQRPNTYFQTLTHRQYIELLWACDVVVGNSSSGVIEAPAAGVPSVNIGNRQQGRMIWGTCRNSQLDRNSIAKAIMETNSNFKRCETFGKPGEVSRSIARTLLSLHLPKRPIKQFIRL